jgi:hypothetical protein
MDDDDPPAYPKIYDMAFCQDGTAVWLVERLYPIMDQIVSWDDLCDTAPDDAKRISDTLNAIVNGIPESLHMYIDLGDENFSSNVMERPNSGLVIIDPIGGIYDLDHHKDSIELCAKHYPGVASTRHFAKQILCSDSSASVPATPGSADLW